MIAICILQLICIYLTHEFKLELASSIRRPLDHVLRYKCSKLIHKIEAIQIMQVAIYCVTIVAAFYYTEF